MRPRVQRHRAELLANQNVVAQPRHRLNARQHATMEARRPARSNPSARWPTVPLCLRLLHRERPLPGRPLVGCWDRIAADAWACRQPNLARQEVFERHNPSGRSSGNGA